MACGDCRISGYLSCKAPGARCRAILYRTQISLLGNPVRDNASYGKPLQIELAINMSLILSVGLPIRLHIQTLDVR